VQLQVDFSEKIKKYFITPKNAIQIAFQWQLNNYKTSK